MNRSSFWLNVAISRARILSILVVNPSLLSIKCHSIEDRAGQHSLLGQKLLELCRGIAKVRL
ncbi:MAG: hypothetical protein ACLQT6_14430 [Desulfomonilaceae bacterium]